MTERNTEVIYVSPDSFVFSSDLEYSVLKEPTNAAEETDLKSLHKAANLLLSSEPVAIPTETVYGLAADATNEEAVKKIFKAKNRPLDNPLIVHVDSLSMARQCGDIPDIYLPLIKKFWPGPLTILVKRKNYLPECVSAKSELVGLRFPDHGVARALITITRKPLAAPSANLSGKPSPTCAGDVLMDMDGKISLIIGVNDEYCKYGLESTIINGCVNPPVVLRPGGVSIEEIRKVRGFENCLMYSKTLDDGKQECIPTTPGMKYRHYAPVNAKVILLNSFEESDYNKFVRAHLTECCLEKKQKVGVLCCLSLITGNNYNGNVIMRNVCTRSEGVVSYEEAESDECANVIICNAANWVLFGQYLFHGLRWLDEKESVNVILTHAVPEIYEGHAIMNRLRKAASTIVEPEERLYF